MSVPPKAVLFDCDGVLVDSEPITNLVIQENLAAHGLTLSDADIERMFVGGTMRGVGETARAMGADLEEDWLENIYADIYARLKQGTPIVAGVDKVMNALDAAGIPYAVGSNGSLEKMQITLGQTGLWERLEGRLFSAHHHGTAKPDPKLYLLAAEALNVAPQDCIVIDDSSAGCQAARRGGMRCLGYAERSDPDRLEAEGAQIVRNMDDVLQALGLSS